MKRLMLSIVIGIPLASIAFGCLMFYFAFTSSDVDVLDQSEPLSKTSWRIDGTGDQP